MRTQLDEHLVRGEPSFKFSWAWNALLCVFPRKEASLPCSVCNSRTHWGVPSSVSKVAETTPFRPVEKRAHPFSRRVQSRGLCRPSWRPWVWRWFVMILPRRGSRYQVPCKTKGRLATHLLRPTFWGLLRMEEELNLEMFRIVFRVFERWHQKPSPNRCLARDGKWQNQRPLSGVWRWKCDLWLTGTLDAERVSTG